MKQPDQGPIGQREFERLVEEYADRVFNIALRITGSNEDAEDAMQEVFLTVYRKWDTFRGESSLSTWLYRITVNAALGRLRDRKRPVEYLSDTGYETAEVAPFPETASQAVVSRELAEKIEEGLLLLPPEYRAAVVLRDIQGLSTAEAAAVLDLNEATLKTRLHRGRVLLRQFLQDYLTNSQ